LEETGNHSFGNETLVIHKLEGVIHVVTENGFPLESDDVLWQEESLENDQQMSSKAVGHVVQPWRSWVMVGCALATGAAIGHFLLSSTPTSLGTNQVAQSPQTTIESSGSSIVVDVHGDVRHPGVFTLPRSGRVRDAIQAAGGIIHAEDGADLNLAAPLDDGAEVVVPTVTSALSDVNGSPSGSVRLQPSLGSPGSTSGLPPEAPLDLNTATLQSLETLPDIGPTRAQAILDYKQQHGSFHDVAELQHVHGIGPTLYGRISKQVTVTIH
jgi:competence protein ComEA